MSFKSENVNLGQSSIGRNNNLDFIRFIAAIGVIISHSFPLSYGKSHSDFLFYFTTGQLSIGDVSVGIFFLFGGYLISNSVVRAKTGKKYFKSRILRIFPALLFVVFLLTFIIGPILTKLSIASYFSNIVTYKYLLNSILIIQHNLPGVFQHTIYKSTVDGPLWTLPVEFMCYILCFFAYKLGFINKKRFLFSIPLFLLGCGIILFIGKFSMTVFSGIQPVIFFYIGMAMYIYRDKIQLNQYIAFMLTIVIIIFACFGQTNIAVLIFFPYIIFTLAYATKHKLNNFSKYGEFSYGIYLWGWPIQQIIVSLFGGKMNAVTNAAIAIPFAVIMGIISYYAVEKHALKLK